MNVRPTQLRLEHYKKLTEKYPSLPKKMTCKSFDILMVLLLEKDE